MADHFTKWPDWYDFNGAVKKFMGFSGEAEMDEIVVKWSDYQYLLKEIGILQERIDKLEGYMQMEDRITASDVLLRLKELEHHICQIDENREAMY